MESRPARRRRFGEFGAAAAVLLGSCGPTQCAPSPPPPATSTTIAGTPAVVVPLEAKPVQAPCTFTDTWGAARAAGRVHEGTDISAAEGSQLYAVVTGVVSKIYADGPGSLAGNGLLIRQPDGTFFFYGHLSALAPGIALGTAVTGGQLVGYVGHTGNAGVLHLHLEIHPGGGAAVNPYHTLVAYGAC